MKKNIIEILPGLSLALLTGLLALLLSNITPVGAVALSIILGIVVGNSTLGMSQIKSGINFSEKHFLAVAIALMGVKLNFQVLYSAGGKVIVLVLLVIVVTITSAILLGKLFNLDKKYTLLLGIGNAVCGSSAIAAAQGVVKADEESVGLSVAVVNFMGTIGIFVIPFLVTHLFMMDSVDGGIVAGSTLQAVGQVVAAGGAIDSILKSDNAMQIATIVKMLRILMLFPVVLILIFAFRKSNGNVTQGLGKSSVPPFIIGFALFSLIPTFDLLPESVIVLIGNMSHYTLIIAMAAVGMKITISSIVKNGKVSLAIGSLVWIIQISLSVSFILLF